MFTVQLVRALRIAGKAVDRDADQVAGDRLGPNVSELTTLHRPIHALGEGERGVVMFNHQAG